MNAEERRLLEKGVKSLTASRARLLEAAAIIRDWRRAERERWLSIEDACKVEEIIREVIGRVPGLCRHCGCSELDPCPQGCGWANSERTVCTNALCLEEEKHAQRKERGKAVRGEKGRKRA